MYATQLLQFITQNWFVVPLKKEFYFLG